MTDDLVVTGYGAVSAAGIGAAATAAALATGPRPAPDVTGLYQDPLPFPTAYALVDFDVRATLGRKGTTFIDRATALALVACGEAIEHAGLVVDDACRDRIGVVLGTTLGSMASEIDYSRETLVADRPYLVNPALFPNTVMNSASGQAAIRYGLRGVNSTVATGRVGFLGALRYAENVLRRGYASVMLVGAVEELTPHTAWTHERLGRPGRPGEAAVVFVVEPAAAAATAGRAALARLVGVVEGYQPRAANGALGRRIAACIPDGGPPGINGLAGTAPWTEADERVAVALRQALPDAVELPDVREALGDCGAAGPALQCAALMGELAAGNLTGAGLLASWSPEGAFAAAVLTAADAAG